MTVTDAYIIDVAAFLPNSPIDNNEIENVLGRVCGLTSRSQRLVLENNKILTRYYALDPITGQTTHTNAQLTAEAVQRLNPYEGFDLNDIECLCCGTSTPDQLLPAHGAMVHGELGNGPCEVVSPAGICSSGITAMKYAFMMVSMGLAANAVATGSEQVSSFIRARFHESLYPVPDGALKGNPALAFDTDFLRWMLSDGAGAAFVSPRPSKQRISMRIDWIEQISFANRFEPCMYAGAIKEESGRLRGWREFDSPEEAIAQKAFAIKQDVKLLKKEIATTSVERALTRIIKKHNFCPSDVDWFLPHYSSEYFRQILYDHLKGIGFEIPPGRWFTNLTTKGNTGSASIYIILEELLNSARIKKGQKLLCFVPESGRFTICYMMLTAV